LHKKTENIVRQCRVATPALAIYSSLVLLTTIFCFDNA